MSEKGLKKVKKQSNIIRKKLFGTALLLIFALLCVLYVFPALNEKSVERPIEKTLLEVWHVETFEGGAYSRKSFLNNCLAAYERVNKGTYVHITVCTVAQLLEKLRNSENFDVISFSTGVGCHLLPYLAALPDYTQVNVYLREAGRVGGEQYAVAYMLGGYMLAARSQDVNGTNRENNENSSTNNTSIIGNANINEDTNNANSESNVNENTSSKESANENSTNNLDNNNRYRVRDYDSLARLALSASQSGKPECVFGCGDFNLPFLALLLNDKASVSDLTDSELLAANRFVRDSLSLKALPNTDIITADSGSNNGLVGTGTNMTVSTEWQSQPCVCFRETVYRSNAAVLPVDGFFADNGGNLIREQTQYTAYKSFLDGSAKILLGTQRDVYKLQNRLSGGTIESLVFEALSPYTDLVQYVGVSRSTAYFDKAVGIVECLLSEQSQSANKNLNMLSVIGQDLYGSQDGAMDLLETALSRQIITPNVFCDSRTLKQAQEEWNAHLNGKSLDFLP